eukprot:CAMPEP_0181201560 /NCGR_PEP_ID=MMETSP1096-20121128/18372_1 /TAXON_ID=156174 ORGANISM="Chrysochromulina ericina, Strain CCMP281" /NCGR_SAMPLE_ID=MMETSP1096 /ASSEMBLY_ACC=CAM_ASM_000453 /LENGTH=110 /DNA_ID=CAMNT_0023292011 /DNA_START=427 /DNA_END=759 /DNA_ORIENTATION=-
MQSLFGQSIAFFEDDGISCVKRAPKVGLDLQIKSQNVTLDCKNVEPFGRANKFAFVKLQTGLCNCSDKKRRAWPLLVEEHVDRTSRHIFWEDNSESHSLADGNAGITDGA